MNLQPYIVKINLWDSPDWFMNFRNSLSLAKVPAAFFVQLDAELRKYNAQIITKYADYFFTKIQFNSEADYTFFLLRWS